MDNILTLEIPETGSKFYLPLSLDACDKKQYIAFMSAFYKFHNSDTTYVDFRINALYALMDMEQGKRNLPEDEVEAALSAVHELSLYIDQYFDINQEEKSIKLKLNYALNHIDSFTAGGGNYYGPADYFNDVTFGEYEDAVNVLMNFEKTQDIALLKRLVAIFYRKKKGKKDLARRVQYNENYTDLKIKLFNKVSQGILYGFYYTFSSFHNYLTSSEVIWEGKVIDMSIIFTEQPDDTDDGFESPYASLGLKSIAFQLSESGVFGNHKELRETNLWVVVLRLYDIRKRDLDRAARDKNAKTKS